MMTAGPTARYTGISQSEPGFCDFITGATNALSLLPLLEHSDTAGPAAGWTRSRLTHLGLRPDRYAGPTFYHFPLAKW
jgi:hypothetical protein